MKRVICLLTTMVLCLMMAVPVLAAGDEFVPSIEIKEPPKVEDSDLNGEDVGVCLVVTSIRDAEEKSTDISQEERDLLLEIYKQLAEDEMELPLEDGTYVVRELVDVSFVLEDCIDPDHGHQEDIDRPNTQITITFDLGVGPSTDVAVLVYVDGEWLPAVSVVNNGDGTVTVVLEDIGVVAFCVDPDDETPAPDTGDLAMGEVVMWGVMMAASGLLLVLLVILRRKEQQK